MDTQKQSKSVLLSQLLEETKNNGQAKLSTLAMLELAGGVTIWVKYTFGVRLCRVSIIDRLTILRPVGMGTHAYELANQSLRLTAESNKDELCFSASVYISPGESIDLSFSARDVPTTETFREIHSQRSQPHPMQTLEPTNGQDARIAQLEKQVKLLTEAVHLLVKIKSN